MSALFLESGERFASGRMPCTSRPALKGDSLNRLFLEIQVANIPVGAVLDTGGAYLILSPMVGKRLGLNSTTAIGREIIAIRGFSYAGAIHRVPVTLPATEGEPLTFDATAFVPEMPAGESWPLPSYLGWQGCLERIRFAVDPADELVYFGSVAR
jgi:hypothetical protein